MHPVGQILNYGDRRKYQGRGTQHIHDPIHVENAPKIDEGRVDRYVACSLPNADY